MSHQNLALTELSRPRTPRPPPPSGQGVPFAGASADYSALHDVLSTKQARLMLGGQLLSLSRFWDIVHQYNVPHRMLGPRGAYFERRVILELIEFFTVRTPADRRRIADGRHKFTWGGA